MTQLDWKSELNLLNDDQLGRIAFASEDSWGYFYGGGGKSKCCVLGHVFDWLAEPNHKDEKFTPPLKEYRKQILEECSWPTELEKYYMSAWENNMLSAKESLSCPEIITEIQNEAKRILEERKQRISEQILTKEIVCHE